MSIESKGLARVTNYLITSKEQIEVKSGKCRFNFRCHDNAVHDALRKDHSHIAMCVYIDVDQPIVHFINVTDKGKFIDNTLGEWSTQYEYYFIKFISKADFFNVHYYHRCYQKVLRTKLKWWERWFCEISF